MGAESGVALSSEGNHWLKEEKAFLRTAMNEGKMILGVCFGAQLLAEGLVGQEVVFTSRLDDSFGAGGTFDTNSDDDQGVREAEQ